ncbi:MAG: hypothetical protein ACP5HW_03160 [Candidatus Micrarchaeia archaeon]
MVEKSKEKSGLSQLDEIIKGSLQAGGMSDENIKNILKMSTEAKLGLKEALDFLGAISHSPIDFRSTLISNLQEELKSQKITDFRGIKRYIKENIHGIVDKSNSPKLNIEKVNKAKLEDIKESISVYKAAEGNYKSRYNSYSVFVWYEYFFDLGMKKLEQEITEMMNGTLFLSKGFLAIDTLSNLLGSVNDSNSNIAKLNITKVRDFNELVATLSHEYVHVLQKSGGTVLKGFLKKPFNDITQPYELEAEFLGTIIGFLVIRRYHSDMSISYINMVNNWASELEKNVANGKIANRDLDYFYGLEAAKKLIISYKGIGKIEEAVRKIYNADDPLELIYATATGKNLLTD